jgi:hypothetical protein
MGSRLVFTNAIAGPGFRLSPSCSPIRFDLVFPRGCLFIRIVNDKGRYRQHRAQSRLRKPSSRVECHSESESIIDRFSEVLLASDVTFCRLYRGVAKQKLDLFEFASTFVAKARAQLRRSCRMRHDRRWTIPRSGLVRSLLWVVNC